MRKAVNILMMLVLSFFGNTQTIEKYSIDSGGTSASVEGIEILYTIGEVNVQELSAGGISVSEGFINANLNISINPILFLQGPIINPANSGLMNDDLRAAGFIPTTSPYSDAATCNASFNASPGII